MHNFVANYFWEEVLDSGQFDLICNHESEQLS